MATLPPWLQISPSDFTSAAIAGGQQGYQAAAQAGELAQRGLLQAAQLASEAANRAAEIAVRREAINAELARNAANVAAARYSSELNNSRYVQQLELERIKEQNAVAEAQAAREAAIAAQERDITSKEKLGLAKINTPQTYEPPQLLKLQSALQQAVAAGDKKTAAEIQGQIDRITLPSVAPGLRLSGVPLNPNDPGALLSTPTVSGPMPLVQEFQRTNAPALPVGGPSTNLWEQFNAWRR